MKHLYTLIFISFFSLSATAIQSAPADAISTEQSGKSDIDQVKEYNQLGYNYRLTDPEQTLKYGERALELAKKIDYVDGIAEAYRIQGIGKYYLNQSEQAIENYLTSLSYFKKSKNEAGQSKVFNNIGNLYRDIDYDKSLPYLYNSLKLAEKLKLKEQIAGLYLNIGSIHYRKKNINAAIKNYTISKNLFQDLDQPVGVTQCLQNLGVAYFSLNNISEAERLLT